MERPKRKHPRLKDFDYNRDGLYFITMCSKEKRCILSQVVGRGILDAPLLRLTKYGTLVESTLTFLQEHTQGVTIDKYVIMPNHVHVLIRLEGGASGMPRPTDATIPKLVSSLKRYTNREAGADLWQTSYHDHIIRDEADYLRIWEYIDENPAKWAEDEYYGETEGTQVDERKKFFYLPTAVNNAELGEAPLDQPTAEEEIWPPIGAPRYPCPCCGYYTFPMPKEEALCYICPVCYWENDVFDPGEDAPSDENRGKTLGQGREDYQKWGAVREDVVVHARKPLPEERPENQ